MPPSYASYLSVSVILRILRMAARHRLSLALGIACAVLAANFQLLIPQYLGAAVDHAQTNTNLVHQGEFFS